MPYQYICPICLRKEELDDFFPKCCGHYMVELKDWQTHEDLWLIAREYEISELEKVVRESQLELVENYP